MMDLRLDPERVIAGQVAELRVRLINAGPGRCSNVTLAVVVPAGVTHVSGRDRLRAERLDAGESADLALRVLAERPGRYPFKARNISYLDHLGRVERWPEAEVTLAALAPESPPPSPRIEIRVRTERLPLGEWSDLRIAVLNSGPVDVSGVTVSIAGAVAVDPRMRTRHIGQIGRGASEDARFLVRADQAGSAVPVHFDVAYSSLAGPASYSSTGQLQVFGPQREPRPVPQISPNLRILMLSANPQGTRKLRLDEEARRIEQAIRGGKGHHDIEIKVCPAVRPEDIQHFLQAVQPQFLHLSGHGADGTFVAQDDHGLDVTLAPQALALMLRATSDQLRCVTINACSTELLARELATDQRHVIAMRRDVLDSLAADFSVAFYMAIAAGRSVESAFMAGRAAMGYGDVSNLGTAILLGGAGYTRQEGPRNE